MSEHSLFGGSVLDRRINCAASAFMEKDLTDTGSVHAAWGSVAHWVCEQVSRDPSKKCSDYLGMSMDEGEHEVFIDQEMVDACQAALDYVERTMSGFDKMYEQTVPLNHLTLEKGGKGTADIIALDDRFQILHIADYKFGRGVKVEAHENTQLLAYASGAIAAGYDLLCEVKEIRVHVIQPRLDHFDSYTLSIAELYEWENNVQSQLRGAWQILHDGGPTDFPWDATQWDDDRWGDNHFSPTTENCRFCKALPTCPGAARYSLSVISDNFVNIKKPIAPTLPVAMERLGNCDNAHLANVLAAADLIESWVDAVRNKVRDELHAGRAVPGFKLVAGRAGARKWTDERAAELMLGMSGLSTEQAIKRTIISPAQAEKLLKGSPAWDQVCTVVTQGAPSPIVVPKSDRRPVFDPTSLFI